MAQIVGACLSQFHDDANSFELLLAYADGREYGHSVSRDVAKKIAVEMSEAVDAHALVVAQNEWLKDRLAYLQLPATRASERDKWLAELGMPSA